MTTYNFLDKFYEIDFTDGEVTKTLRFQIADTPIAEKWLERVRWVMAQPDCHIFENQWIASAPTKEKIKAIWKGMKKLVDEANSGEYIQVDFIDMPEEFDESRDNRQILNYLHYEFHRFEEELDGLIVGYDPLIRLNVDIHILEAMIDNYGGDISAGFFLHASPAAGIVTGTHVEEITDPSLYEYFLHDVSFGDLLLGYHTVGKNIYHCFVDNDVELVKKNMIRPQRTISNEVVLSFSERNREPYPGASKMHLEEVKKWVHDNELDEYVDMSLPENQAVARPLLGQLVNRDEVTYTEVNEILELGKVSAVRLIE
jgi:hypothetical protein